MKRRRWFGLAATIWLLPGLARAATYYTSLDGDDARSCSEAQSEATPKATVHGGAECLAPGDVLAIRGGTYDEEFFYTGIPSGTSWAATVTLAAYPGETVVLRPTTGSCDGAPCRVFTFVQPQQYIVLEGLVIDAINVVHDAVKITCSGDCAESAHHIRLKDCEIMNAPGQGILGGTDSEFIGLSVHDNGTTDFDHGIYTSGNNNLIEGCEFYNNAGWGIHKYPAGDNVIIRNNRVHDNARVGDRGTGIGVYGGTGNLVYNNLVWGNKSGIVAEYGESNVGIYANTVYGNENAGIYNGSDSTDASISNNLVYANGTDLANLDPGTTVATNLCGSNADGCTLVDDPKFVDPEGTPPDFHLLAGSPAIDSGADLSASGVTTDFDGAARPFDGDADGTPLFDVGAYEYTGSSGATGGSGSGGATSTTGAGADSNTASGGSNAAAGNGAEAGSGDAAEGGGGESDGSCSCRVPGPRTSEPGWWWLVAALAAVTWARDSLRSATNRPRR